MILRKVTAGPNAGFTVYCIHETQKGGSGTDLWFALTVDETGVTCGPEKHIKKTEKDLSAAKSQGKILFRESSIQNLILAKLFQR